ncbi:PAS domain-containing sensor histidine kinase [Pontibaca sp. S1109L]|uniref:histidine kinase n=2 Tax=Pontibaca salina TaxID=2795731 RepID=A0A934HQU3_9RHOB|nr:PAS domain-containing sensor histidine kinase [Pontibaca salina]
MIAAESKYSLTWRVTPDLLGILNNEGYFEATNPAWQRVLGYHPSDIQSRRFFEFIHPADLARTHSAFDQILIGKPILGFENRYRHRNGSYRYLSWNGVPEGDKFFCSARDITEQKANEIALRSTEAEARFREQFIAVLGHDLRNPLAAISAAGRMIARSVQDQDVNAMLGTIDGSVDRMTRMIDDVMDFTRARLGGGITIERRRDIPLRPSLEHAINEIRLSHPHIQIEERINFDDPVYCDPQRICQMLSNLLANAVAHGSHAHPVIVVANDDDDRFMLSVINSGDPIPTEARDSLFEPFTRGLAGEGEGADGLGLGLFITAQIAEAHHGRLSFRSDRTATEFTFVMQNSS